MHTSRATALPLSQNTTPERALFLRVHIHINLKQKPSSPSFLSNPPNLSFTLMAPPPSSLLCCRNWATLGPEVPVLTPDLALLSLSPPGLLAEKDSNYCLCRTPCNLTRYNKELSMVKIPSKTSAKYLEKKFNKSEKYIS